MKKTDQFILVFSIVLLFSSCINAKAKKTPTGSNSNSYTLIIEGFDWGPAVNKIIVSFDDSISSVNQYDFSVLTKRNSEYVELPPEKAAGARTILFAYVSDSLGNRKSVEKNATLVLAVGPELDLGNPMTYTHSEKFKGSLWLDYKLTITQHSSNRIWNREKKRIMPGIDKFDLTGEYTYNDDLTMVYASYKPKIDRKKSSLLIWLHGGGEGGRDLTLPLLANKTANYASDEIQAFFGGAYVLVPQCPGAWMHNKKGIMTSGRENDIYNEGLMALIKNYVASNPEIDSKRIYIGGCSNGGYMSFKLLLLHPDYFAAAYISAFAYKSEYLTDEQIKSVSHIPIWFVHSSEDRTTFPHETVIPVYKRLIAAGATDVHLSYYKRVTDITGFFGGENYYYNGHLSWIYSHANHARLDYDGKPVTVNGWPVTIMEWLSTKSKK